MLAVFPAKSQAVDHWETVVYDSTVWRYFVGTSDPGNTWATLAFDDASWPAGRGGVGYGDGDDRTITANTLSVFLRKKFQVTDKTGIAELKLHVDYDDGFIAFLNGVEIARSNMGTAATVAYNQPSAGLHEAMLYAGGKPEGFVIPRSVIDDVLTDGENVLAIQVHNENLASSDLSSSTFLSAGITDATRYFYETPSWFTPPITSSNLPLIVINTNGQVIQDEPRITADMGIIDNGAGNRNSLGDPFNNYEGKITLEFRGESSQMFPKKSLRLETVDESGTSVNVALLGMPAENDWVLYAPYTDKTMMRDVLAYKMGNDLGDYAPRTRYVEVVINGEYQGVYVLIERIKRDKNRVDIANLKPEDVAGDDVTGGYILRVDKIDANDYPGWISVPSPRLPGANDIIFQFYDPKGEDLQTVQKSYVQNFIYNTGSALASTSFRDEAAGYRKYIDIASFINYMIVTEVGKNIDSYGISTYMHKDKDSNDPKLHMGPLWDFNLAYGNVDYLANAQFAPGWMWDDQHRMFWFRRLVQDPYFANKLTCRWKELRTSWMTNDYFTNTIDSIASLLSESQQRNYDRWPILGVYVWPNQYVGNSYADELNFLKQWIMTRLDWMDKHMPGTASSCGDLVTNIEESLSALMVYPNPAKDQFLIDLPKPMQGKATVVIYNSLGSEVSRSVLRDEVLWDARGAGGIVPGVYTAVISFSDKVQAFKLVLE